MIILVLNYTYRLDPDSFHDRLLKDWLLTCRVSYNYALRELKDWIECQIDRCSLEKEYIMPPDYPFPGYQQQQNNLPAAKKKFPRLAEVPSQVLQTKQSPGTQGKGNSNSCRGVGEFANGSRQLAWGPNAFL